MARLETIKNLNRGRFDYVLERSKSPQPSIEESCKSIGRTRAWFYRLPDDEQKEMESLAEDLHKDSLILARLKLQEAAPTAAGVVVDMLDIRDPRLKLAAAQDILNRTIGKAAEKVDHNVSGTVNLEFDL